MRFRVTKRQRQVGFGFEMVEKPMKLFTPEYSQFLAENRNGQEYHRLLQCIRHSGNGHVKILWGHALIATSEKRNVPVGVSKSEQLPTLRLLLNADGETIEITAAQVQQQ